MSRETRMECGTCGLVWILPRVPGAIDRWLARTPADLVIAAVVVASLLVMAVIAIWPL
jgi:hypothetical protein